MKFEEVSLIIEGVSKAQKEAGQRAMAVKNATIKSQLITWFNERWTAKNAYKNHLNLKNKLNEKELAVHNIKEAVKIEVCRNIDWALRNWEFD